MLARQIISFFPYKLMFTSPHHHRQRALLNTLSANINANFTSFGVHAVAGTSLWTITMAAQCEHIKRHRHRANSDVYVYGIDDAGKLLLKLHN